LEDLSYYARKIETYIIARDRFLKPNGRMLPMSLYFCGVPISNEKLYKDIKQECNSFWHNKNIDDVDFSGLESLALKEAICTPLVKTVEKKEIMSQHDDKLIDLLTCKLEDVVDLHYKFNFKIASEGEIHALGLYCKTSSIGTAKPVDSQMESNGNLYKCIALLLSQPLVVKNGSCVSFKLRMVANERGSYNITMKAKLPDIGV
jgi:histone-arginine methyltransferase CARM1